MTRQESITSLLQGWRGGDREALDRLVAVLYAELHRIAAHHLRGERPGHTLRPTELVSEAWARLVGAEQAPSVNDRIHFLSIAARTMRQVLVDHARKRTAARRGRGERAVTLDEAIGAVDRPEELVALDEALEALGKLDERKARVLQLHYFGGLTQQEIAELEGLHVNTVARDLAAAEAWVGRLMNEEH